MKQLIGAINRQVFLQTKIIATNIYIIKTVRVAVSILIIIFINSLHDKRHLLLQLIKIAPVSIYIATCPSMSVIKATNFNNIQPEPPSTVTTKLFLFRRQLFQLQTFSFVASTQIPDANFTILELWRFRGSPNALPFWFCNKFH